MRWLSKEEKIEFVKKHSGKEMRFTEYYKYKFNYEFYDENGTRFLIICGDTSSDIYRDSWKAVEKISDYALWLDDSVHDIAECV